MSGRSVLGFRPLVLISGLPVGGAESVTARFLSHLAARGRTVPVCTATDRNDGPPAEEIERAGVPRFDLRARRLVDPLALGRLVRLLRREKVDLVHAHGQDASILAAAASLVHPASLVVTRHVLEEPSDTPRRRIRAVLTRAALRRADAVVAVSGAVADRLRASTGVPLRQIRVIPNGIRPDRFDPGRLDRSPMEVRGELDLEEEARVVLVPSVMREGKGHEQLLTILPAIHRQMPEVRVLFAGGGEREDALRHAARSRGMTDIVSFLGFREDVPELMAAADLVVLPSSAEALPTVLLEAAAAGRPVVATRVGGTPEVVEHGRTGLLVPAGDGPALGRAIVELLRDEDRARRLGREARSRVEEHFGIERQAERTLALWRRVAADGGSRTP